MYLKISNKNYSFRYKIPIDLRQYFHGRHELIVSLKTKDAKLAKTKAMRLGADTKDFLERIRWMEKMKIENVDKLVIQWLNGKLRRDFDARLKKSSYEGYSAVGLPEHKKEDYTRNIKAQFHEDMKLLRLNKMKIIADDLLNESVDINEPSHKELMFKLLQANITLFSELDNRNRGEYNFELMKSNQSGDAYRIRMTYSEAIKKYVPYLEWKSTSDAEKKRIINFLNNEFKIIFGENNYLADYIDDIMDELYEFSLLPSGSAYKIRAGVTKETLLLLEDEKISSVTYGNYMKWSKAFFKWAFDQGHILSNIASSFKKNSKSDAVAQRSPLTDSEVINMLALAKKENVDLYLMLKVITYTGMRHSEFFKMSVTDEGYDLQDESIDVKTFSSHRVIPKHNELLNITDEEVYRLQTQYSAAMLSKLGMRIIRQITDDDSKVVYSLRHSMANKLLNAEVSEPKINQILGHLKGTSTSLNRYANGYDIEVLREAINLVHYGEEITIEV